MTDIQSAAERLRRHMADPNHRDTYHGKESTLVGDWATLARAYLAEHPADDGEAIQVAWLVSMGFEALDEHDSGWFKQSPDGREMEDAAQLKTRGDLRLLCRALGILLTERPQ
jgi:hypothetical protein